MAIAKKLASMFLGPAAVSRDQALAASERLSATTSLVSSLEYLAQRRQVRKGGLNDWRILRGVKVKSAPATRKFFDVVGDEKVTMTLHAARAAASAGLLLPGKGRWRGAASLFLGLSNVALYARHRMGTDGSDQVTTLVQTANGAARLSRSPEVQDALMWYVAVQSNLSYVVSGWVKLLGHTWRDGSALGGIMRTRTYGHEGVWKLTQKYPVPTRYLAHGVLALECLFPLAYARRGAFAKPVIGSAAAFHVANGFAMGLGRFVGSFTSMHPMVAYTSTPRDHPAVAGRDDRALAALLAVGTCLVGGTAALAALRRARALDPPPGSRTVVTRHGNELRYNSRVTGGRSTPVLVFCAGLAATSEHFSWITDKLVTDNPCDLVFYSRAGYGPSRRRAEGEYTFQESVDDLVDLIEHAVPAHRSVILVGHSLGGELCRRAAGELGTRLHGVAYLDSSHPAELQRSQKQHEAAEQLSRSLSEAVISLRLGLGALLSEPDWLRNLPASYRTRLMAQYGDSRLWTAGRREWQAVEREFRAFAGPLPAIDVPALVISAQRTVDGDPEHLLMHKELADIHRDGGHLVRTVVLEGADHDSMLTQAAHGTRVCELITEFFTDVTNVTDVTDSTDTQATERSAARPHVSAPSPLREQR